MQPTRSHCVSLLSLPLSRLLIKHSGAPLFLEFDLKKLDDPEGPPTKETPLSLYWAKIKNV